MPHQEYFFWGHEIAFHLRKTWLWEIGFKFFNFSVIDKEGIFFTVNCCSFLSIANLFILFFLLFVLRETQMSYFYSLQRLKVFSLPFFFFVLFFVQTHWGKPSKTRWGKKKFFFFTFFLGNWILRFDTFPWLIIKSGSD